MSTSVHRVFPTSETQQGVRPRQRFVRRVFVPSPPAGPYRLPREVDDRLVPALKGYRNREESYRLATFLPRFWATPDRLTMAFPIAREALCIRRTEAALAKAAEKEIAKELGLTEKRVRSAIATLVEVDYLAPLPVKGNGRKSRCQMAALKYHFGPDYGPLFAAANRRAKAARQRQERQRRAIEARTLPQPQVRVDAHFPAKGPGGTAPAVTRVSPGPLRNDRPPLRGELIRGLEPDPAFLARMAELDRSIRTSGRAAEGRVGLRAVPSWNRP